MIFKNIANKVLNKTFNNNNYKAEIDVFYPKFAVATDEDMENIIYLYAETEQNYHGFFKLNEVLYCYEEPKVYSEDTEIKYYYLDKNRDRIYITKDEFCKLSNDFIISL